ncbi:MAG: hypothetical protein LKJ50_01570 [Clostridiales bacterium]|jgi:hypothetical protein|nr:hypothetical protein [Clostridiales bacterium]MCI1960587.1 hypothetical protein [Clostridiales bacterium]MCI2021074.1 hypothetical protein [Clostridiales bacterium]MCI2025457.1 hypothetical protein [Clostridiales bacterium]
MSKFDGQPDRTFGDPVPHKEPHVVRKEHEIPKTDRPIRKDAYPVIDTDFGRDNLENDMPEADLQDL